MIRIALISLCTFFLLVAAFTSWFFLSMPDPEKISGCLVTTMFEVDLCEKNRSYVKLQNISKYMKEVVVISEDASFYEHDGFDWFELENSFRTNWRTRAFARGGSTITQQLAKNVFLNASKNPIRKLKEAYLAHRIEEILEKKEILEKYLNVVEFGPGLYGIGPAARHYFGKSASELTVLEASFLAYLLPNPKIYSQVYRKGALTAFSRRRILDLSYKMYRYGRIRQDQYLVAKELIDSFPWKSLDSYQVAALNGEITEDASDVSSEEWGEGNLPTSEEMMAAPIEGEQEHLDRELTPEEEVELENALLDE